VPQDDPHVREPLEHPAEYDAQRALDGSRGDQPGLVGGQPAEQRGQREDQQAGDEDPAALEQVAGPGAEKQQPVTWLQMSR
jgi:hypothetical protein